VNVEDEDIEALLFKLDEGEVGHQGPAHEEEGVNSWQSIHHSFTISSKLTSENLEQNAVGGHCIKLVRNTQIDAHISYIYLKVINQLQRKT
jgi:hypothetical protein